VSFQADRCRANMAHIRQSRPDSDHDLAHIRQSRPDYDLGLAHIRQSRPDSGTNKTVMAHIRQSRPDSGTYKAVKARFWTLDGGARRLGQRFRAKWGQRKIFNRLSY